MYEVVVETLWREPDSVGRVYPRLTTRMEYGAARQTEADVVMQTHDTIYVSSANRTRASSEVDVRAPSTMSVVVPWMIVLGLIVVGIMVFVMIKK